MKPILKFAACILLIITVSFASCKKDTISPPPPPPFIDSLAGKEFIFNDLIWLLGDDSGVGDNIIWCAPGNRPALFYNINRPMEVFIRLDGSNTWVAATLWSWPQPYTNGYLYGSYFPGQLFVVSYPLNYLLVGTRVSIKVKFL